MIIPTHVQIETVNGMCTSRCTMCSFKAWKRKPHIMDNAAFGRILQWFKPYLDRIQYLSLQGWGEPLLDKGLAGKIQMAKDMGWHGVGFATNATELKEAVSRDLIAARVDSIICGIDGVTKKTHEAIRCGTNFDTVVANVKRFIRLRNETPGSISRVVVRLIRQKQNAEEWPAFKAFWLKELDAGRGDDVLVFDIHNCAGNIEDYDQFDVNAGVTLGAACDELFSRLMIISDGRVAFCNADVNCFFELGSAVDTDPVRIFNNDVFNRIRQMMKDGRILELEHCRDCTIPRSRMLKKDAR